MQFNLNGQNKVYDGDPDLSLLQYLREIEGIISPKDGCAPQAACGCCAVQVDGKPLSYEKVLSDSSLAQLLSDEGPIALPRYVR